MGTLNALSILILDDEPLARERLRTLLSDCGTEPVAEFGEASSALDWLSHHPVDVALVDIRLPGMSGMEFARQLSERCLTPPALIFTTALDTHAVDAFELAATDYLLKPVRLERLRTALERAAGRRPVSGKRFTQFTVRSRDRVQLVPLEQARYLKAELKYVTLVTASGQEYLLDDSLIKLEEDLGPAALRIHRNCLVMRHAIVSVERIGTPPDDHWAVQLTDVAERLPVSRRQLAALRAAVGR
ncbi:LytTR family DNA-binding domain-containing protein [Neisseriaceae bacterium JH1-16]|nr:LytTR family DNA-binding domain-containing protein [Neisseriaceae bacterium JH1-16]